jgi:hypothetical protein
MKKAKQKKVVKKLASINKRPAPLRKTNMEANLSALVSEELQLVFKTMLAIDKIIARQFAHLDKQVQMRSARGIVAHLRACRKNESPPDFHAIREIITDAKTGSFIFEENERERQMHRELETRSYFGVYK